MKRFPFKWTAAFLIWFMAAITVIAFNVYWSIPNPATLKGCFVTRMNQVDLCPKKNTYVPFSQISTHLKNAVIVSEDTGFFSHNGFEIEELKDSLRTNLSKVAYVRGASTITQQLARNLFLTPEKSILRKAKEALIAYQLETHLSKNEIFERYLNVVEFGHNIYGVKAAARHYFGKSPSELTVLESSYLAFLLPSPKRYAASFKKGTLTKFGFKRIHQILYRLAAYKKISDEEFQTAKSTVKYFPWKNLEAVQAQIETERQAEQELQSQEPEHINPNEPAAPLGARDDLEEAEVEAEVEPVDEI